MIVRFDPHTHTYWYGDEQWPSVTQAIDALRPEWGRVAAAAQRGTLVHKATEERDRQTGVAPSALTAGYLTAYDQFLTVTRPTMLYTEQMVFSGTLRVAGRVDRILTIDGQTGVLDIKTGVTHVSHGVQIAGYALLASEMKLIPPNPVRWALYLRPTGRFKLVRYVDPSDYGKFARAVAQTWQSWRV